MADRSQACSVWLGSETGILKGVSLSKKQAFNFCEMTCLSRDQEVCALSWGDPAESELLVASLNGTVKTFSTDKGIFTETRQCGEATQGRVTGLAVTGSGSLVTCLESGRLRVWKEESDAAAVLEVDAGQSVYRMRQNPARPGTVATGGKENGLKVWDLERPDKPVFAAKNLRNDWLDLRQPEWLRDLAFIPDSDKIVTCTAYHQVRVYDPSTPQRRPVLEAEYGEYPLTALSLPANQNTVVVGNTQGFIAVLDLRKGLVRGCLKGLAGGVRSLQCHPSLPVVASCGLDRFLRIHSLTDRKLLHKVYLKSRLNCVLLSSRDLELAGGAAGRTGEVEEVKEEGREEDEEVWDAMEKVEEKTKRKTVAVEEDDEEEKKKKMTESKTVAVEEDDDDEEEEEKKTKKTVAVDDDDEEEEEKKTKGKTVVVDDDEEEEKTKKTVAVDDEEEEEKKTKRKTVAVDDDDEEEEEKKTKRKTVAVVDDEEEEEKKKKKRKRDEK